MSNKILKIDKYIISEPIINILNKLKTSTHNGKLKDIRVGATDITVTCPNDNHDGGLEHNPDCHINIEVESVPYGYFHCFACGEKGGFVKFVALYFSSSEEYAKNWLITNFGVLSQDAILIDDEIVLPNSKKNYLDEAILDQYQKWCPYLGKRKLNRDICEKFKVRYDPYYRQVIFPIYDTHGHLKMLAKRSIDTKFFHMDKDQEKEVYGLNIIQKNNVKSCMIVEGPIDLITCYTHNVPAIALLGTPSAYQISNINKSCIINLFIATDNDDAGEKFATFLDKRLSSRILTTRVQLPKNRKDVNDLTAEEWNKLINEYNLPKIN